MFLLVRSIRSIDDTSSGLSIEMETRSATQSERTDHDEQRQRRGSTLGDR